MRLRGAYQRGRCARGDRRPSPAPAGCGRRDGSTDERFVTSNLRGRRPVAGPQMVRHTNDVTIEPSGGSAVTVEGARALARLAKTAEMALGGVDLSLPQYRVLIFLSENDA